MQSVSIVMGSSVEKRYGGPPSLISNLKDALKSRNEAFGVEKTGKSGGADHGHELEKCGDFDGKADRPVVLVTNEDGIQAVGLRALVAALVSGGFCNVYVCAPYCDYSGVGHSITTRKTLEVSHVDIEGVTAYEVLGTPADCVSLSLSGVLFPQKPNLVLCGINKGSNCGYHIFSSGTVAGAREAFICGVPSFALSLDWKKGESYEKDFNAAAAFCMPLVRSAVREIQKGSFHPGFFLNINMPTHPSKNKGFRITRQGISRLAMNWRVVPLQKGVFGMGLCKENAIGVRVAQLGLAACAVGAARQANSSIKNIEVESVAGPTNGSHPSDVKKKYHYQIEVAEVAVGVTSNTCDFGALQEGFVTVTPLGSFNDPDPESSRQAADWIASSLDLASPLVL